jgi:hypothetical protein
MRVALPVLAALFLLGACTTPNAPPTVTVTQEATLVGQTPKSAPVATPTASAPAPVREAVVPDVVGKNHQVAQDTMQAAGFYNLAEEDATGQGRMLVSDRNWQVVGQIPAAGTTLATTGKILLRSKKLGE